MTAKDVAGLMKGRMTVPLGKRPDLAEVAGLPWGSIATLHAGNEKLYRVVGPAISQTGGWVLPILDSSFDPAVGLIEYRQKASRLREELGLEAALS